MSKRDGFDYSSATIPPGALFVEDDEPLLVFPSIRAAENFLKADDVESGCHPAAYGPNGEQFAVRSEQGRVTVARIAQPDDPERLKAELLRYLEACEDPADAHEPLHDLVARAWAIERGHWMRGGRGDSRSSLTLWLAIASIIGLGAILKILFG
jgi:hypothetical protein